VSSGATGTAFSGTARRCVFGNTSIGDQAEGSFTGYLVECKLGTGTPTGVSGSNTGRMERCTGAEMIVGAGTMIDCIIRAAQPDNACIYVATAGAQIHGCTLIPGTNSASAIVPLGDPVTAAISGCRMPVGIDANVTNSVSTPYNIVDSAIA